MNRFTATLLAAATTAAFSPALHAQWPLYPKPGVPKAADGKVNLTAPAPRTPDGKPDLTGIWMRTARTEKPGSAPAGQPRSSKSGRAATTTPTRSACRKARCSSTWIRSRARSSSCRTRR
jgi:hypothetical protein